MSNYPFDRKLIFSYNSSKGYLSITGQFLTEHFINGTDENESPNFDFDCDLANPQIFKQDYLFRYELEKITRQVLEYLLEKKKRSNSDIVRAAQIIREEIWKQWDYGLAELEDNDEDKRDYYTGEQAEDIGPKSFRTWAIYSDPYYIFECIDDDWLKANVWRVDVAWTTAEIMAITALWTVDETLVYLNKNKPYKAATWFFRASDLHTSWVTEEYFKDYNSITKLAQSGGAARAASYKPLIDFVVAEFEKNNYPSRRNAAKQLKNEVIERSKKIGKTISEHQAEITITNWLRKAGLPANIPSKQAGVIR